MRRTSTVLTLLSTVAILAASLSAWAHHSFSAEFDVAKPVKMEGTVKDFEWTNPHAWLHLEVKDDKGNTQMWAFEFLGVNALVRGGMTPKTLKAGDKVTVSGFAARDGTNTANASSLARTETGEFLWNSVREERK
jgi:hypothetical protein